MNATLGFTVEEGFLTKYCRSLVLENNWRRAVHVLTTVCRPALSVDDAVAVLKGDLAIAGNERDGFQLVSQASDDPDFQQYQRLAQWQKAGLYERDGFFYQPYAEIVGFTESDERYVIDQLKAREDFLNLDQYREARARYHMRHPDTDLAIFDDNNCAVLMKRVPDPAFWVPFFEDPLQAVADFRQKRESSLEQLGTARGEAKYNSNSWEFYFQAALAGVLHPAGTYTDLSNDDWLRLQGLVRMRDELDAKLFELERHSALEFSESGIAQDEDWHRDRFEDRAYALLYQTRVEAQAENSGGFMMLTVKEPDGEVQLRVPRAPFLRWVDRRNYLKQRGQLPPWTPVCPSGMKMMGDDSNHTDWWVGAGLLPKEAYDHSHPVNKAAWKYAFAMAKGEGANCVKLAGRGKVTGPIVFPKANESVEVGAIAVVTHAGVDFELALLSACKNGTGAVIAEVGGKLAHLATVSREMDGRMVVVDGALSVFRPGEIVTLDLDSGTYLIHGRNAEDVDDC